VLAVYGREHAPRTARGGRDVAYAIPCLLNHWSGKRVSAVTARACRTYKGGKGRRELETLQAAIRYWHREYGPLTSVPVVTLPDRGPARERWLTRDEAARFLWEARRTEHLKRFILIGLHTGSRAGVIFALRWDWIDFERGVMRRRDSKEVDGGTKRRPPVRVSRRMLSFLRRWKTADGTASDGYVVHVRGRRIARIREPWERVRAAAGLPGITPHVLRYTRATWLMQAGVPIWQAAGHLGMTTAVLESVYGHHSPTFQDQASEI
jgi:integrase